MVVKQVIRKEMEESVLEMEAIRSFVTYSKFDNLSLIPILVICSKKMQQYNRSHSYKDVTEMFRLGNFKYKEVLAFACL